MSMSMSTPGQINTIDQFGLQKPKSALTPFRQFTQFFSLYSLYQDFRLIFVEEGNYSAYNDEERTSPTEQNV